jgi:4-hydroxythreonine-4-phosphate dehydrogenase
MANKPQSSLQSIAISIGEPSGIGPEVILKALSKDDFYKTFNPLIYAPWTLIMDTALSLGLPPEIFHLSAESDDFLANKINVIDLWKEEINVQTGVPNKGSGAIAFQSLEHAFKDVRIGKMDALVTAPIDKKNIQQKGFSFPGHTEYLAAGTDTFDYLMLLVSGALRVGVVTGHIPLKSVADALNTADILKKVKVLDQSLKNDFGIKNPKIALLGLNPHAGDGGLLGEEEETVIQPAIDQANALGINAFGPFPADGFFGSSRFKEYDGILGMYHDQGLIPFKAASFGTGVNFTAGLPIIRCSPDHGTAYDIAGKGLADERSMHEAIEMALAIVAKRRS